MTQGVPGRPRDDDGRWPRWVKLLLIVLAAAALIMVAVMLLGGGGGHGPGRHLGSPAATVTIVEA